MKRLANFIGGAYVAPVDGKYLPVYDPSRASVYAEAPDSDATDVEKAYVAASAAFPQWSATSIDERFTILNRIADLIMEHLDELAAAESWITASRFG